MGQNPGVTYQSGTSNHFVSLIEAKDRFILEFRQDGKVYCRQETYKPVQYPVSSLNMPAQMQAAGQSIAEFEGAQIGENTQVPPLKRADEMIDTLMKPASAD